MERRDALKSLAALAGATGMSITPVTAKDAEKVTLVILKQNGFASEESMCRLRDLWKYATEGTDLANVKTVVMDGQVDVEFVRG